LIWVCNVYIQTSFAASGVGYICGVLATPTNASVYAIISTFTFCVFSGVEPTLRQIERLAVLNWAWYTSFATWTAELTYITWTKYLRKDHGEDTVPLGADYFGYQVDDIGRSVGLLIFIGIGLRVIAIILLYKMTKK
jgi:hypothetical protein